MRLKGWLILVTATALAIAASWYHFAALPVTVTQASRGPAIEAVYATGLVEPSVLLPIAPRIGGHLVQLSAREGQSVRKGQVLAQLEALDVARTVEEQSARARYANQQQQRTASLVAQGFYSGAELDRVTAEANATQAALRRAKALHNFATLTAPSDGVILRRDAEVGQFVSAGQVIMSMACCAPLRVSAEVDEEDIPLVRVGQAVLMHAPAFPQQVLHGQVASITPKGDSVARSYRVRISLAEPKALQVGMTVEANLITRQKPQALLLPSNVLQTGATVWVIKDGKAQQRTLKLGIQGQQKTEILAGLAEHEQVIWPIPKGIRPGRSVVKASMSIPQGKQ
jgi:RND family efflux transporter MFP subunit